MKAMMVALAAAAAMQAPAPIHVGGEALKHAIAYPRPAKGKAPAVVIAPGQGYHMGLPLTQGLAEEAVKAGFVAARFDWRYLAKGGEPAEDLAAEVADLEAVLERVKADPRVDPTRIVLAGKSLGTMVAWRVLQQHPEVKGAVLLTPIFRSKETQESHYPGLAGMDRPVAFLVGDQDAGNCALSVMYEALAGVKAPLAKAVVVAGNHGLEVAPRGDAANGPNVKAAVAIAVHWLGLLAGQR